jgi:hypothetical protein
MIQAAAQTYAEAGICALPAIKAEKRPAIGSWRSYQDSRPSARQLAAMYTHVCPEADAVCILTGKTSGHMEAIDFDQAGELFEAWKASIDPDVFRALVIERTPSGGYHAIYRCAEPICGNVKLAQREGPDTRPVTLIETRGEGGLILCYPSPGYELIQGDLADLPTFAPDDREHMLAAAWALNEYTKPANAPPPATRTPSAFTGDSTSDRPGDDFNARGDIRDTLKKHGWQHFHTVGDNEHWTRPGKKTGTSATLKAGTLFVHSSNAAPFDPQTPYSPYAAYALLEHRGDYSAAAAELRRQGYGAPQQPAAEDSGVDLAAILGDAPATTTPTITVIEPADPIAALADPGPVPLSLMRAPGFISEVMDLTLARAHRPNQPLAFAGAIALQAVLAGRKIKDIQGSRTNPYLMALAPSGTGKDFPRQVNAAILHRAGLIHSYSDRFASGEGLEDAMLLSPAMLFQTDEIDHMLRAVTKDRDGSKEGISGSLLRLFSAANSIFPMRRKAGQQQPGVINQPCLVLFGTAVPEHFYAAINSKMATDGLLARMVILEAGERGAHQIGKNLDDIPARLLDTATWWRNFAPGGNLSSENPQPAMVPWSADVEPYFMEIAGEADTHWEKANSKGDETGRAYWSRAVQHASTLALIRAASEDYKSPRITRESMAWAWDIARHSIAHTLYQIGGYSAESAFDAERLKLIRRLRNAGAIPARELMRFSRLKKRDFDDLIDTMTTSGELRIETLTSSANRPVVGYRLNT